MRNQVTAGQAYAERLQAIKAELAAIETALGQHGIAAAAKPGDWGFAGDLGHVQEQLTEVRRFLAGDDEGAR